jgi:hypothetical protein
MRTGAFCAINRAPFAASYGAALTALHSSIYGIQPVLDAAKLFSSFVQMQDTLEEKISRYRGDHKVIAGFGRPLIPGPDERVLRLKDILKKQQWIPGPHFNEFLNMEILLKKKMNLYSNYASVIAALLLDPPMSLNIKKINILAVGISHIPLLFSINDVDEHLDEYDPLLPLKVSDILYKGREKR